MAGKTITSADAVITITVPDLFDAPIQLQQFSADNVFATESLASAEVVMGIDGYMTAGFVYVPIPMNIELLADSDSVEFFDQWWQANQRAKTVYYGEATVLLPAINTQYSLTRGVLNGFPAMPDAAKTLRARRFGLVWNTIQAAPIQ